MMIVTILAIAVKSSLILRVAATSGSQGVYKTKGLSKRPPTKIDSRAICSNERSNDRFESRTLGINQGSDLRDTFMNQHSPRFHERLVDRSCFLKPKYRVLDRLLAELDRSHEVGEEQDQDESIAFHRRNGGQYRDVNVCKKTCKWSDIERRMRNEESEARNVMEKAREKHSILHLEYYQSLLKLSNEKFDDEKIRANLRCESEDDLEHESEVRRECKQIRQKSNTGRLTAGEKFHLDRLLKKLESIEFLNSIKMKDRNKQRIKLNARIRERKQRLAALQANEGRARDEAFDDCERKFLTYMSVCEKHDTWINYVSNL